MVREFVTKTVFEMFLIKNILSLSPMVFDLSAR